MALTTGREDIQDLVEHWEYMELRAEIEGLHERIDAVIDAIEAVARDAHQSLGPEAKMKATLRRASRASKSVRASPHGEQPWASTETVDE